MTEHPEDQRWEYGVLKDGVTLVGLDMAGRRTWTESRVRAEMELDEMIRRFPKPRYELVRRTVGPMEVLRE